MPEGLKRYHHSRQSHFITFSCYHRQPRFCAAEQFQVFVSSLEHIRHEYGMRVFGYVIMPEHVHLLLSEPERATLAQALQALKVSVAKRAQQKGDVFWQKRYYDRNVRDHEEFVEKLRYMHRNPVKRGLVEKPEDWPWSSFRHYALRELGEVEIESEWTARAREQSAGMPP
jgi:putative transposase